MLKDNPSRSWALMRVVVAMLAMALFVATTPATAGWFLNVCEGCHEGMSDLKCGVITLNAISGCCGQGDGTAECSGDEFTVECDGGGSCTCDEWGDNCEPSVYE